MGLLGLYFLQQMMDKYHQQKMQEIKYQAEMQTWLQNQQQTQKSFDKDIDASKK